MILKIAPEVNKGVPVFYVGKTLSPYLYFLNLMIMIYYFKAFPNDD